MITGMKLRDSSRSITSVSIDLDVADESEVRCRRAGCRPAAAPSRRAWMKRPSWPFSPTARAAEPVDVPDQLLVELVQHHLDDLQRRSSVMRMPRCRRISMPICCSSSSMRQPPPWTTIGFMPTRRSSATSRANPVRQRRVGHRAAAEPDHQRRRVVGPDVRERLGEDAGLLRSGNAGGGHGSGGRREEGPAELIRIPREPCRRSNCQTRTIYAIVIATGSVPRRPPMKERTLLADRLYFGLEPDRLRSVRPARADPRLRPPQGACAHQRPQPAPGFRAHDRRGPGASRTSSSPRACCASARRRPATTGRPAASPKSRTPASSRRCRAPAPS